MPGTVVLAGTAGAGVGVATALAGIIAAPLFVPGTALIGLSLLVIAVGGVLAAVGGPWFRFPLRRPPGT